MTENESPFPSSENMAFQYDKADAIEVRRLHFIRSLVDKSRDALTKLTHGHNHENAVEVRTERKIWAITCAW